MQVTPTTRQVTDYNFMLSALDLERYLADPHAWARDVRAQLGLVQLGRAGDDGDARPKRKRAPRGAQRQETRRPKRRRQERPDPAVLHPAQLSGEVQEPGLAEQPPAEETRDQDAGGVETEALMHRSDDEVALDDLADSGRAADSRSGPNRSMKLPSNFSHPEPTGIRPATWRLTKAPEARKPVYCGRCGVLLPMKLPETCPYCKHPTGASARVEPVDGDKETA